jgi:membrane protein YqaA with SNARE-associated domain
VLRASYDWMMRQAASPGAERVLALVSFVESSVFPIPPDVMLIPMVLARPERAWRIVLVATAASVLGGIAGYVIGYFLYETVGLWVIELYGLAEKAEAFRRGYEEWGLLIVLVAGFSPLPYKVITIASGAAAFDPVVFTLASIVSRGARFLLVAVLLRLFGSAIRRFIEARLGLVTGLFAFLLVLGFVALRYLRS